MWSFTWTFKNTSANFNVHTFNHIKKTVGETHHESMQIFHWDSRSDFYRKVKSLGLFLWRWDTHMKLFSLYDIKIPILSWTWWHTPVIPACGRSRQEDCEFEERMRTWWFGGRSEPILLSNERRQSFLLTLIFKINTDSFKASSFPVLGT